MYALNPLSHFHWMSVAAESFGARAELDFETLRLEVAGNGQYFQFEPGFLAVRGRLHSDSNVLEDQSVAFTGWRYGPLREWEIATDKRAFKEFCARNNLRTPRAYTGASEITANVLMKEIRPAGSLGVIRGPFAPKLVPADSFHANSGWFLEEFILGDIALAHFCEGELFAVEARKKPRVTGDGRNTVRELIENGRQMFREIDWQVAENVVRLQGASLDRVLPEGKEILVDVRFWSALQPFTMSQKNVLGQIAGTPLHEQLVQAGPVFWSGIPEDIRANAQFQLYCVVDAQQRAWFVDMDAPVYVDPHSYRPMLRRLFGVKLPEDIAASVRADPIQMERSPPQRLDS